MSTTQPLTDSEQEFLTENPINGPTLEQVGPIQEKMSNVSGLLSELEVRLGYLEFELEFYSQPKEEDKLELTSIPDGHSEAEVRLNQIVLRVEDQISQVNSLIDRFRG